MLEEERDCLLEPDSDESAADEAETPHMEISDDEETGKSVDSTELVPKPARVGMGNDIDVLADTGNAVGREAKMASAEGALSGSSSKLYGVGTPVSAPATEKSSSTCTKPPGVGAPRTVELSGAISTIGEGTNATTASLPRSLPVELSGAISTMGGGGHQCHYRTAS